MLPGKKYTPEDFVRIAWNRKWLIAIPTAVIAAGTFVWSYGLPNRYRAETTILVVPQRVPETYVRSTVTSMVEDRLQMISQQILSRSRLERIVQEFNLYEQERKTMIMEDVIERMRTRDVKINVNTNNRRGRNNDATSFSIAYDSPQPRTAMQVTERLSSLFVQENLEDRELLADSTNQFLQAQLEDARRRLIEHEKKLEEFRTRNAGRLPSQVQANIQMIQSAQTRLQALAETANRERDRLLTLQQALSAEPVAPEAPPGDPNPTGEVTVNAGATVSSAQQLEAARGMLRELELRLKPQHPDVARAKRVIAELEAKVAGEAPLSAGAGERPAVVAINPQARARFDAMRLEAQEIQRRLASYKEEDARLQKTLGGYATRLEASPALESDLVELMRDYSTLQESYTVLLKKGEESKIAVNLERRQIGEQFRILDSARLPEKPVSPDRQRLNLMGLLGGLGFSLAIVAFLEYRDTTVGTDDDVVASLALPVLAVIPAMTSAAERRRSMRQRLMIGAASLATIIVMAGVAAWKLRLLDNWIR